MAIHRKQLGRFLSGHTTEVLGVAFRNLTVNC